MATYSGASSWRADRWLAGFAPDLEPLGDDARALLRRRFAAHRRASFPSLALAVVSLGLLVPTVPGLWSDDVVAWGRDWSARYLVAITLMEIGFLLRQHRVRRADARIAAGLAARVARGEHVPLATVVGRVGLLAAAVSAVLAAAWAAVLIVLRPEGLAVAWAVCIGLAAAVCVLGVRRAVGRPAIAVDATSLAIDERLRVEEASTATMPLWLIWLAMSPAGLGLPELPRWAAKGLALSTVVVMLLVLGGLLRRVRRRPGPGARP